MVSAGKVDIVTNFWQATKYILDKYVWRVLKVLYANGRQILKSLVSRASGLDWSGKSRAIWQQLREHAHRHLKLLIFNGLFLAACLIILVISLNQEGRRIYEVSDEDTLVVILDIGHGGRDPGAVVEVTGPDGKQSTLYEHALALDVGARLNRLLSTHDNIAVLPLLTAGDGELPITNLSIPPLPSQMILRSTPPFDLKTHGNSFAVNMRWLLASEFYARAMTGGHPHRKVVFLSLHMDEARPRAGGLTIYVPPGRPYPVRRFEKRPYTQYREVRDWLDRDWHRKGPMRDVTESNDLANAIVRGFERHCLAVCPEQTVRSWIKRLKGDYVPAVLKYNEVPTRLLLELVNLADEADQRSVASPLYRERIAMGVYEGLLEVFYRSQSTTTP